MDIFTILSYLNKVSLVAFFITTVVVAYQIYIFKKEKTKEQTPSIPDFKEKNNFNVVSNYTSLPSFLTKKQLKAVNYSKSVFVIISLLTIIVVVFVVSLIKKNSSARKEVVDNTSTKATVTPTVTKSKVELTSTLTEDLIPTPTAITPTDVVPTEVIPTEVVPTEILPEPTEIVLANNPSISLSESPTEVPVSPPQVLPETGSVGKALLIIGAAVSTIFFSFFL